MYKHRNTIIIKLQVPFPITLTNGYKLKDATESHHEIYCHANYTSANDKKFKLRIQLL